MASTVIDFILFRDAFGTEGMREIFSDRALIKRYIEVEVALARAEARCSVIPVEAADAIARESKLDRIDFDHMRQETDIVGYPILPLVHQMVQMRGEARSLRALGRDDAGHHGHRQRAAGARPRSIGSTPTCARCAASSPTSRRSTATRRWPAGPTCSRRCR
jgi:hypothetical protein